MRARRFRTFALVATIASCCALAETVATQNQPAAGALVRLSQARQGAIVMEESCAIIYRDGRYRSEKFFVRRGDADSMRANTDASRITEGQLTDAALASLEKILDAQELRDLKPPSMVRHLADEDLDALSVTVARQQGQLQQLNYPTRASRKGAARTLKPLLEWWQDLRKQLVQPVSSLQRTRCLPQSSW